MTPQKFSITHVWREQFLEMRNWQANLGSMDAEALCHKILLNALLGGSFTLSSNSPGWQIEFWNITINSLCFSTLCNILDDSKLHNTSYSYKRKTSVIFHLCCVYDLTGLPSLLMTYFIGRIKTQKHEIQRRPSYSCQWHCSSFWGFQLVRNCQKSR